MAECNSNLPSPHTERKEINEETGRNLTTSGISQDILTRISDHLCENVEHAEHSYPSVTKTSSPTSSSTSTIEADSSVVSPSGQFVG